MQVYERERELHEEIAPAVEGRLPEVEVLAVELAGPERLTVFIDHPSGVDHSLCERVTGLLGDYLDRFTLDVSSPGIERPLRKPSHFADVLGRRVAIRTARELGGRKRFRGEVVAATDDRVTVATGGDRVEIPYAVIARGNLIEE